MIDRESTDIKLMTVTLLWERELRRLSDQHRVTLVSLWRRYSDESRAVELSLQTTAALTELGLIAA